MLYRNFLHKILGSFYVNKKVIHFFTLHIFNDNFLLMFVSLIKMSAKLTVHKFENESNYKSLHIYIENNGDVSNISHWQDGISESKKNDKSKPRLVVKMISDENFNLLDLDSCAQKFKETEEMLGNMFLSSQTKLKTHCSRENKSVVNFGNLVYNTELNNYADIDESRGRFKNYFKNNDKERDLMNPLEYSLERVKEYNARIMENIHKLNRTLSYTKHQGITHPRILGSYPCEECGKYFVYETGLRRHVTVRHACDTRPRWQVVWTCAECFQVWPQQELALDHAKRCHKSGNEDGVREIKTSSLLQCEFCEKVFTSIPRLLTHFKLHTVTNNYECKACDVAFLCYKTAEQHWTTCVWLKMYYQFTLQKLLLCNACDKKFRSYDQLYNHRYKMCHFIPKPLNDNNYSFTSHVYQCEICGRWFNEVNQLQEHRHQYHPHCENGVLFNIDLLPAV